jgi:hypothetical protein
MPNSNINLMGVISLFVSYWPPPATMDTISAIIGVVQANVGQKLVNSNILRVFSYRS